MAILKFPPIVPDGVYYIRALDRYEPDGYLEWQAEDNVKCETSKEHDDVQRWKITAQTDDTYTIENVASKRGLCWREEGDGTDKKYILSTGTRSKHWTLEPRGDEFVIAPVEKDHCARCVDVAENDWVVVWPRRDARNQRWVLDSVHPDQLERDGDPSTEDEKDKPEWTKVLQAGLYNIRNSATNAQLSIWSGWERLPAPVVMWNFGAAHTAAWGLWTVIPTTKGYLITNSYYSPHGARFLTKNNGDAAVSTSLNLCRLFPVKGKAGYFHIAIGTEKDSQVLSDIGRTAQDYPARVVDFRAGDENQHWQFVHATY